jgi:aminomethyltransferase
MSIPAGLLPSPFQDRVNPELSEEDFIPVSGQAVPLWLTGPALEYDAFRNTAGLIDFSMLYKWEISGPTATETVNSVFSRDVSKLSNGSIAYGVIVSVSGTMIDDCTVLKYSDSHYRITGGNKEDEAIIKAYLGSNSLSEVRNQVATLSLQGPRSREILQELTTEDLSNEAFPYYTFKTEVPIAGIPAHINRMGFTAELGYEIMVHADLANELWDAVASTGAKYGAVGCGAIALMMVRVEAGMIMAELEYDHETSPFECRMGWAVELEKGQFHGRDSLVALKDKARHTVVSVTIEGEAEGVDGATIILDGEEVGLVTMAVPSPELGGKTLALAKLKKGITSAGQELQVVVDGNTRSAVVVATPVYDPERKKVRS